MTKFRFIHHACFLLENEEDAIIFDPFLAGNPQGIKAEELKVSHVLVSHAHDDHIADAFPIAKKNNALLISTAEIAGKASAEGGNTHAMHLGGTHLFPFGKVRLTPAFHGSGIPGGHACGFIVDFYGTSVYFAGDTALFSDMQLLGELEKIDYAILPIGDNFTMGPSDAVRAIKFLGVKKVIPVHYNTWPVIAQDPVAFKAKAEAETNAEVFIVNPGETLTLT